ncbi:hypothetical protein BT93_B2255 [Corymbia citriodora subsp. variegata]|nr:hypothetical protein BT93_B2255 [Corymbia citriodora subsp. variegata]
MIMSASGFPSLALGCFLLALVVAPHVVHGLSRSLTQGGGAVAPSASAAGLCASEITIHGYQCQEFDAVTKDGYILSVQRIPEGRAGGGSTNKQPVFVQHGVLADGSAWLVNLPEQSLPLILADNGFDVWIANSRGTQFSRRHTSLSPSNPKFWDWSWDELAAFDLPAVFDLIHEKTGKKVHYVGHSLGTTIALASLSEGKLVDKLQSVALLSPVAYLTHITTALGIIAARSFLGELVADFLEALCARPGLDCYDFLTAFSGPNCCLNVSTVDLFLKNYPQSTSMKNLVHLSQTVRDGGLAKYNYEIADFNMEHYGDARPPVYNLSNIPHNVSMFLSYGGQDALADPKDVQLLLDSLKLHDVGKLTVQFVKDYAHMDFLMGLNAKDIVYSQVLSFFKNQH